MRGNDFMRSSFSVPMGDGKTTMCAEKGKHSATDSKGRCVCCGEKIAVAQPKGPSTRERYESGSLLLAHPPAGWKRPKHWTDDVPRDEIIPDSGREMDLATGEPVK